MKNKQAVLASMTECSADGIWLYDFSAGRLTYANPAACRLLGYSPDDFSDMDLSDILTSDSPLLSGLFEGQAENLSNQIMSGDSDVLTLLCDCRCKNGTSASVEMAISLLTDPSGRIAGWMGTFRDVSRWLEREKRLSDEIEEKDEAIRKLMASEKELASLTLDLLSRNETLRERAITDELTGLSNRFFFGSRAAEEVERAGRYKSPLSLIIADLDRFKNINDVWGHDIGDKILVSAATIFRQNIRKPDILARWGGEEFALLVPQTDLLGSAALAEKLRNAIGTARHPVVGAVTASFGVAEWIPGEPFDSWFRRADQALYQAKSKGRNCVVCSSSEAGTPITLVRLEWKAAWECGHTRIDSQHHELVRLSNSLLDIQSHKSNASDVISLYNKLVETIIHHFTEEEKIIDEIGFPDTPRHAERHQIIIKKILRLNNNLLRGELSPATFFTFLVDDVIVGHILTEDVLYFPYLHRTATISAS